MEDLPLLPVLLLRSQITAAPPSLLSSSLSDEDGDEVDDVSVGGSVGGEGDVGAGNGGVSKGSNTCYELKVCHLSSTATALPLGVTHPFSHITSLAFLSFIAITNIPMPLPYLNPPSPVFHLFLDNRQSISMFPFVLFLEQ